MKKRQKFTPKIKAIGAVFGIVLIATTAVFLHAHVASKLTASVFLDTGSSPYENAISFIKESGIAKGYSDGTFKPNSEINRAEFTKILVSATFPQDIANYTAKSCFKDTKTSDWFSKYVCLAKDKGIIGGYSDDTFRPTQNINVSEALKISLEAFEGNNIPSATGEWYQKYLNLAYSKGYMIGEWEDTSKKITRGEMSQYIYQIKLPQAPAKNISINFQDSTITPFSVISIKGAGFDPLAATSVIFKATEGDQTYTIPALDVTSDTVAVSVPPLNYDAETESFTGGNVSMQVIQIRTRSSAFAVSISNELSNILISAQLKPSIYKGNIIKNIPKGTITASFIVASIENLKDAAQNLPTDNAKLQKSFTEAKDGLEDLLTAVNKVVQYQGSPVILKTNKGTMSIDAASLAQLDAVYLGYMGTLEQNDLISFENNSWMIPTAHAAELSECVKRNIGGGLGDTQMEAITGMACGIGIEPYERAHEVGSKLLPLGAGVTYGFPLAVSGMMLGVVAETLVLSKTAEIAIATSFSYLVHSITESKNAVSNAATSIAKSITDLKLGAPFLESGLPVVKFLYEANKALNPNDIAGGKNQAVVADPDKPSQAKIIKSGDTALAIISLKMPPPSQSKVLSKDSTELVIPEIIPIVQPEPTPTTSAKPTLPSPNPTPTPTGKICFIDDDCGNPDYWCNQGVCEECTEGKSVGSLTLTSATCIHKTGEDTHYNKGNYVQTTGTVSGPVGSHLEWASGDGPEQCGSWHRASPDYGACIRQEGDPESSTWTLTQSAYGDAWWYEILLIGKDGWETYQHVEYGDVCK